MNITEYLNQHNNWPYPHITCVDGFSISVQAGEICYSDPKGKAEEYTSLELGYPSEPDNMIKQWAENKEDLVNTVYPYVPVEVVDNLLEKHGGILP